MIWLNVLTSTGQCWSRHDHIMTRIYLSSLHCREMRLGALSLCQVLEAMDSGSKRSLNCLKYLDASNRGQQYSR